VFDIEKAKKESGLAEGTLKKIEDRLRQEFPDGEMLFELHMVRMFRALKEAWITLEDVIAESKA